MKNHHDYDKVNLGSSDIASVILRAPGKLSELHFGFDGSYSAYLVDEECEVPESYALEFETEHWLDVYDDNRRTLHVHADKIKVFSRGNGGCIIQIFGRK